MTQSTQRPSPGTATKHQHRHPKRADLVLHFFKTSKLVLAILADRRVPIVRKAAYLGIVGFMLAVLLFPEALGDFVLLLSFFPADILGIPLEGAFDWVTFAVASFSLLKLFPKEVVGEHYDRLFRR